MKDGTIISDFPASGLRRIAVGQTQTDDQADRLRIAAAPCRAAV
jgi:hypothetical protein